MASALMPGWLHLPSLGLVEALWTHPITVGHAVLAGFGVYIVLFVLRDLYSYYMLLPLEMRGTLSSQRYIYVISSIVRSYRALWGMDGTSSLPIRRWVASRSKQDPFYAKRFLKDTDLPVRRGPRATLLHQGIPHRQIPQVLDPELEESFKAKFRTFAAAHSLTPAASRIEHNALALFLPPPPTPPAVKRTNPEMLIPRSHNSSSHEYTHIHGGEGSMHVILAPLDAALAIDKGWAVRFPLAGAPGWWGRAQGRVLVYAPRDEGEVEIVMRLVEAGWEYLTAVPE